MQSVRELAASVLARKEVALASQVLAGGEHVLDRAIELAAAVAAATTRGASDEPANAVDSRA